MSFYNPKSSVHWVLPHDMVNPAAARSPPTHGKRFLGEQRMTVIYLILRKCIVIKQFFPKTFVVRIYHESCVLSAVIYLHDVPTLFFPTCFFIPNLCCCNTMAWIYEFSSQNAGYFRLLKTCSCRLGFSSMGRNDESTLFFDGSNW